MTNQTKNSPREWRHAVILVVVSLLLALVLVEGVLRVFDYPPRKVTRFLFFSRPGMKDQIKSFGFHEHQPIREVAIYKTRQGFQVEFDTSYSTNNLGLVQKNDFDPQKQSLVFIGDSFTQGEGAPPWFYELEKGWRHHQYQLVNLGLMGTGLVQWRDTLEWFAGMGKIKHVYLLFISDDWLRRRWYAHDDLTGTSFTFCTECPKTNGVCHNRNQLGIIYLDKDWGIPEIINKAREIPEPPVKPGLGKYWNDLYVRQFFRTMFPGTRLRPQQQKLIDASREAFDRIVDRFGRENVTVLHLPLKSEVSQGEYNWIGKQARDLVRSRQVAYFDGLALCGLTGQDYHANDNHPNASGYAKILDCLRSQVLKNNKFQ